MEPNRLICTCLIAQIVASMVLVLSELDIRKRKLCILYNLDRICFVAVVDTCIAIVCNMFC